MDTRAKLTIVGAGLAIAAAGLVWGAFRPPAVTREDTSPLRPAPAPPPRTPSEVLAHSKEMESFRKSKIESHERALKELLNSEDSLSDDFCGKARRSLRYAIDFYAFVRFTDYDSAVSYDLMSGEEMKKIWSSPEDAKAIRQANGRLQHGYILKGDFDDSHAEYLKIFSFPDEAARACPGPIARGG